MSAAKDHMSRWSSRGSFGKSRNESVIVESTARHVSREASNHGLKMYQDD
jgi:hypothetical protein